MKKVLFTILSSFIGLSAFAQGEPVLLITEPASLVQGIDPFTYVEDGTGTPTWGSPNMTIDSNLIEAELIFVKDANPNDSLAMCGCDPLTTTDVAGKIAVINRGACEFGTKVLNAQNAGAVGVIIVNYDGQSVIGMAGGADGMTDTIPAAMVMKSSIDPIRTDIESGGVVCLFGVKDGHFNNDIGFKNGYSTFSPFTGVFNSFNPDSNHFSVDVVTYLFNMGKSDQTNVEVNAKVMMGTTELYNELATVDTFLAGDTLIVSFPDFKQGTYTDGMYEVVYTISSDSSDAYDLDNSLSAKFDVNGKYLSYASQDADNKPVATTYSRADLPDFESCIAFKTPEVISGGADGDSDAKIKYFEFLGAQSTASPTIDGASMDIFVYEWNDDFEDLDGAATMDDLNEVADFSYIYDGEDFSQKAVKVSIESIDQVVLSEDQRYLVCLRPADDYLLVGYDETNNYLFTNSIINQPVSVINSSSDTYVKGFGDDMVPSLNVGFSQPINVEKINVNEITTSYPNPAIDLVNIPVSGSDLTNSTVKVYNTLGKVVLTKEVSAKNGVLKLDVTSLTNGLYTVELTSDKGAKSSLKVSINK